MKDFEKFKSEIPIHISKINKEEEKDYPYIVNQGFAKNNEKEIAYIYNVTTNTEYRKKGIYKQLMSQYTEKELNKRVKEGME